MEMKTRGSKSRSDYSALQAIRYLLLMARAEAKSPVHLLMTPENVGSVFGANSRWAIQPDNGHGVMKFDVRALVQEVIEGDESRARHGKKPKSVRLIKWLAGNKADFIKDAELIGLACSTYERLEASVQKSHLGKYEPEVLDQASKLCRYARPIRS